VGSHDSHSTRRVALDFPILFSPHHFISHAVVVACFVMDQAGAENAPRLLPGLHVWLAGRNVLIDLPKDAPPRSIALPKPAAVDG
jgi:hypothetical protein